MPSACRSTPVVGDPTCDISTSAGPLTLAVVGTTGSIRFQKVTYDGSDVPGTPVDQITLQIKPGKTKLVIVYSFSDPDNGAGELREVCATHNVLDSIDAGNPAEEYNICA